MLVGRNDPCPCGSGRKYKQCHLRQDQVAASREHALSAAEALAMNAVLGYATSPRFAQRLVHAFHRYWGGTFSPASASTVGREPFQRMLEWFACDYVVDSEGHHIIDLYLQEMSIMPQDVRGVLEAWAESNMGVFRVLSLEDGDRVSLFDLLRERQLEAQSRFVTLNARQNDFLLGRYVHLADRSTLSPMTAIYPHEIEEPLAAFVRRAYALYQEEHYQADWDRFLRAHGDIFQAFLISDKAAPFRRLIGPGTPYVDPAHIRKQLYRLTQEEAHEQRRRTQEPASRTPPVQQRASGIIVPGTPEPQASAREQTDTKGSGGSQPHILIPGRDT